MKRILSVVITLTACILITSCSSTCDSCGYYSYPSSCGAPSCTDNDTIMENSNPCPGTYNCS